MLRRTITYNDYNGNTRTEDFYFNLNQAEVTEMELSVAGGLTEMMKRIVAAQDGKQIIQTIKEFIRKAYGVKSPDGKRFIKSEALSEEFEQTEAYNILFMELVFNADKASAFFNAIVAGAAAEGAAPVSPPAALPAQV